MAFHFRKVLQHLSAEAILWLVHRFWPKYVGSESWGDTDAHDRKQLEQILLAGDAGGADLIASLERIHQMANDIGDRAMIAACGVDIELRRQLTARPNTHERALWLFVRDSQRFGRADEIRHADHFFRGQSWTGFIGPRGAWPEVTGEPLELFKSRLETVFRPFDGSGANIVVETFERGPTNVRHQGEGRVFQLVAYLEGLPSTSTEFDDVGIIRRNVRPAKEVTLVYAPDTGVIDVVAHAGWQLREAVAKAFTEELFPQAGNIEPVRLRQVRLDQLARPQSFPVDPADGIDGVRLMVLRLAPEEAEGRLTLEVVAKSDRTLHDISRSWFGSHDPLAKAPAIKYARIAIRFHPDGRNRARTLQVELREPHGCNLRDRSDMERLIGEKYLKRWDLVRDV